MVGRMTPGKGHEEFLNAAKLIINKSKVPTRFLIVGSASYGEELYEKKIRSLASKLMLNNVIIFTGFRKDIPRILNAVDILAFPSHEESFGVTLLEAMAMEIPVVASNTAGVPDIVTNGKTGILIPPKNPIALANALIGLAENSELRMKLGKEGRRRVENFFNID
ncbi:MAG: glycosyltransferase, partial [Ignavibacteria bacterium]